MSQTLTDLLTTDEVCQQLNIHRSTIIRWVKSGRLAYAHQMRGATGAYFFTQAAVDAAVRAGRNRADTS